MSLPEHLHPKTYWEERCELLEESVFRLASILANSAMPPQAASQVRLHVDDWNRLIAEIGSRFPPPEENSNV